MKIPNDDIIEQDPHPLTQLLGGSLALLLMAFLLGLSGCDDEKLMVGGTPMAVWSITVSIIALLVWLAIGIIVVSLIVQGLRGRP